jgi:hypothetical protein
MEYHSVYLIFELLYLKYQATSDSSIRIEYLRDAFYELEFNVNEINNCNQEVDFESELEKILEDFSCIFETCDDEISFVDEDPGDLYEAIPDFLDEEPTAIDLNMEDFVYEDNIYQALRLTPPLEEMQSIFEINKTILFLYELIAKLEIEGKDTTPARKLISFHKACLKDFFKSIDNATFLKIKICLGHYNDKYLTNETKTNINASWYLALLSNSKHAKKVLSYDKLFHYIDKETEPEDEEDTIESKDLIETSFNREISEEQTPEEYLAETCFIADELEYFLANYILYLNSFISKIDNPEIKRLLISKKYLLLSIGDLEDTEEYYLNSGTLDRLPIPSYVKEWFNPKSFDFLIGNFEEILESIRISNQDMVATNQSKVIINLLLLKVYLDLSINEEVKKELIAEITNPNYYKNSEYSILTTYIDNIIFQDREKERKRCKNS